MPLALTADEVSARLCTSVVTTAVASRTPANGGAPTVRGIYAWWTTSEEALPDTPVAEIAGRAERLLYVGIVPRKPSAGKLPSPGRHLRQRLLREHLGAQLGGSTFRMALVALLWEQQGWTPLPGSKGLPALTPDEKRALRAWQDAHLRVSWCEHEQPWTVETAVIKKLGAPFNLASNSEHPYYDVLAEKRSALRRLVEA